MKKYGLTFINVFLLAFMLLIFGPAEIYFANVSQFEFIYTEFAGYLAAAAVAAALAVSAVMVLLPDKLYRVVMSLIFGISFAGYLQVMFFNGNLDLLGQNPDGYQAGIGVALGNLCIWFAVIAGVTALAFIKKDIWKKVIQYASVFLLCIQTVALASLLLTARDEAFHHKSQEWHLSGENQYVVSAKDNVILLILDYFSNERLKTVEVQYPDMTEFLSDFTYYNNVDCNYFGTFPSITHMLTGKKVDASLPINDWCRDVWTDADTIGFYEQLREKNYVVNLYTPDTHHLCGTNEAELLRSCFSNVTDETRNVDVFYKLMFKTMTKMSCYRMMPEIWKPVFYTDGSEYENIVTYEEDVIRHSNADFYTGLLEQGLTTDRESSYFTIQHLLGTHEYTTTAECTWSSETTLEDTARGCMVMVEEYLNQLKELGVYDDATIIITADHGDEVDSQVIFYVKQPGERHEEMKETNAPVSLHELRPTVAMAAGLDASSFGQTIYDFSADQQREREVWVRGTDPDYPYTRNYAEDRIGHANVYRVYRYIGEYSDLLEKIEQNQYDVVEMKDSFY